MKFTVIALALLSASSVFGQIQELQLASDAAQDKMGKSAKRAAYLDPINYVNPFIGTGGHGHTFPGAVVPFGMAQVSPDTRPEGWDGCSGYHYSDSVIYGFANTHLSGTGIPDYSDVLLVPQVGKANLIPGYKKKGGYGYAFSHKDEVARAGFYSVKLANGIQVKLTATERCAIQEYDFTGTKGKRYLLIDLGYRDRVLSASAVKESNSRVTGSRVSEAWAKEQHLYFDLQTNVDFKTAKWIINEKTGQYQMLLTFPETVQHLIVKIGLSGTDVQGASKNLEAEAKSFDFEWYQQVATGKWRKELEVVQVSQENKDNMIKFYTALYHAFTHPSVWSDVDGRYRTFNNTISKSDFPVYSVFSLWDTYRAANPLYTILQPQRTHDFIESFRLQAEQTGVLPMWTLSNNETDCMIGYHAVSIITDAYAKGIPLEKPEELLRAMVNTAKSDRYGRVTYGSQGFISADIEAESVSKTLEYAYDDWCIAEFARMLGKTEIENEFRNRSASYLNSWNQESGFFQPRSSGVWLPNFVPNEVNHHFTEANAWQYSMAPQHNIAQMKLLHGGEGGLERFLDRMFNDASGMSGREQADITGLIGQYAHGNEPSHHMAYAYNYCGAPWKTQELVRRVMDEQYRIEPDGLSGNEDCGQMSSWLVLSALGFYPYCPGSPTYTLGSPLFKNVAVKIGERTLAISALDNDKAHPYVQDVSFNGKTLNQLFITQDMLKEGGIIDFTLSESPNKAMETYATDNNAVVPKDFIAVPYFDTKTVVFEDYMELKIEKLTMESGQIAVSINGADYEPYTGPLKLNETTTVKALVIRDQQMGGGESKIIENTFRKFNAVGKVLSISSFENHYAAGGEQNILDGRVGGEEYRSTEWQGFNNKDVDIVIQLDEKQQISSVILGCMQDTRSWIFAPKEMIVEGSLDGVNYFKVGKAISKVSPKEAKGRFELVLDCAPTEVAYLRIKAVNFGKLPAWHISAGNPTWIFLDELTVK